MKGAMLAAMLVLAIASPALGWGEEGHRIAAEVAEQYLAPAAARQTRTLLGLAHATTLAEIANWADEIRAERRETARWHFVAIPIHPPAGSPAHYDATRDCPGGDCVVSAIGRFVAVLGDQAAPPDERFEALKFVVHLVADIHQPLDCADDGDDRGNGTHVIFLGQPTSLYALWETRLLAAAQIGDARAYARGLVASIVPENLARWRGGAPIDWANESHGLARLIYGGSHEARALQLFYETDFLPVVNVQLEKAGIRLAALLNDALK
jgi:S1/P1 Nuclease